MYTNGTSQPQAPTESGQGDHTQTKPVDWDDDTQGVWEEVMAPFGGKFIIRANQESAAENKEKAEKLRQHLPPGVPVRIVTSAAAAAAPTPAPAPAPTQQQGPISRENSRGCTLM